jgi:hypothetical protein
MIFQLYQIQNRVEYFFSYHRQHKSEMQLLITCVFDLQQIANQYQRELKHLQIRSEPLFLWYFEVVGDMDDQIGKHFVFYE